jgi:hypothetical protein
MDARQARAALGDADRPDDTASSQLKSRPELVSFMPGVLLFVGLATHVLVLLGVAVMLAIALYRGTRATRWWTGIWLVAGLLLGLLVWQPLHIAPMG